MGRVEPTSSCVGTVRVRQEKICHTATTYVHINNMFRNV